MVVVDLASRPRFFIRAAMGLAGRPRFFVGAVMVLAIGEAISTGANVAVGFFGLSLW